MSRNGNGLPDRGDVIGPASEMETLVKQNYIVPSAN